MKTDQAITLVFIAVLLFIFNFVYVKRSVLTIEQNGDVFEQVGLMAQKIDGDTLYIPVYKLRNKQK